MPFSYYVCPTSKLNGLLFSIFFKDLGTSVNVRRRSLPECAARGFPMSYLGGGASPHSSTAEMWGDGRCGFLSRQSVTQIEAFFMLIFPFFQTSKVL